MLSLFLPHSLVHLAHATRKLAQASTMPLFLTEQGYSMHQVGVVLSLGLGGATLGMFLTPVLQVIIEKRRKRARTHERNQAKLARM